MSAVPTFPQLSSDLLDPAINPKEKNSNASQVPRIRILLTSFCSVIGAFFLWRHFENVWSLALLSGVSFLFLLSLVLPRAYAPIHKALDAIIQLILKLFTWAVLGAIYFLIFTPIRLILSLRQKDFLNRRPDPKRETYWEPHDPRLNAAERFKRLF